MSETLAELEQRLGDGTVAKIAELLGLPRRSRCRECSRGAIEI